MAAQSNSDSARMDDIQRPLPVVSCDSHAGPRLVEDLRPYCPSAYLAAFDDYVKHRDADAGLHSTEMFTTGGDADARQYQRIESAFAAMAAIRGHHDMAARLADMDKDGITAEVIFPTAHNGESEPFIPSDLFLDPLKGDRELMALGMHIYACWLADACKCAPDRLLGLVTPPLWDIDASIREVEWAAKMGLRGVYLLMPRPGIPRYDRPEWERFWAVCADHDMMLNAHAGAPMEDGIEGPHSFVMMEIETGGWPARKAMHQMLFSGVFERHPRLKMALTEQNYDFWSASIREFDSAYSSHYFQLRTSMPRKPSEYMSSNVFIGGSFFAPFEARDAVNNAYVDNVMWGRDYGHIEGTFVPGPENDDVQSNLTRLSMRYAFADQSHEVTRKMVSDNAIAFYNLDRGRLDLIAQKIGSPSQAELDTPIDTIPANGGMLAFRQVGPWG